MRNGDDVTTAIGRLKNIKHFANACPKKLRLRKARNNSSDFFMAGIGSIRCRLFVPTKPRRRPRDPFAALPPPLTCSSGQIAGDVKLDVLFASSLMRGRADSPLCW